MEEDDNNLNLYQSGREQNQNLTNNIKLTESIAVNNLMLDKFFLRIKWKYIKHRPLHKFIKIR